MMPHIMKQLLRLFFPHRCFLCGAVLRQNQHMCRECAAKVPYIFPPICERCGRGIDDCICGGHHRHFERCISPFSYDGLAKSGISVVKNEGFTDYCCGFAMEMAEVVRREYGGINFDLITAVPLHREDDLLRGFNPAERLALALSKEMRLPYERTLMKRFRTKPQKELKAVERGGNLLGAFDLLPGVSLSGKIVLLVDDVITTGSTLDECAKMLKMYGAEQILSVTAAATILKKFDNDV